MEWRRYITPTGTLVIFAGGVVVHTYLHPFDLKKHSDTHVEGYELVRTTDNIVIALTTGDQAITPPTGTLTLEGYQGRAV